MLYNAYNAQHMVDRCISVWNVAIAVNPMHSE